MVPSMSVLPPDPSPAPDAGKRSAGISPEVGLEAAWGIS